VEVVLGLPDSPANLPKIIDAAVESTAGLLGSRPVTVVTEYPAHLPPAVGGEAALERVVASLIASAVRTAEHGEIKVRASVLSAGEAPPEPGGSPAPLEELAERGPWLMVTVSGAGGPVPVSENDREVPAGTDPSLAGTAPMLLDLDRCRAIVEGLGGRLWVDDPEGLGQQASFVLPLLTSAPSGPDVTSLRRTVEARLPAGAKATRTLLLVVDHPGLGDLLTRDLSAAGYGVMLAGNGTDGLAIARQTRPDLILLDLMVRQPSAFDIATLLRQDRRTRGTPILFLTLVGDSEGGVSVRAVNYLVRPSGTGALVSAVNAILTSGMSPSARVLVVEPNSAIRDTMVMMIQSHGYRVTEAAAPEEALALAERMALGLILVNAKLAQERDFWLLRNLRQVSADTGIYVLAEGLSDAEGKAAVSRGASGYSDTGQLPDLLNRVQNGKD
jgi:DNA-binding response OmpR family regulator